MTLDARRPTPDARHAARRESIRTAGVVRVASRGAVHVGSEAVALLGPDWRRLAAGVGEPRGTAAPG